jgi:membrane-bound metal-dependent hydrolase YbcI (DUF457 family)
MRGSLHLVLHTYYLALALMILYGDAISTSNLFSALELVLRAETLLPVLVFLDVARAPDCDLGSCRSFLGKVCYTLVKPFVRKHRGWYHSFWASLYVASLTTVLTYLVALWLGSLGIPRPGSGVSYSVFLAALSSYNLHLLEDGLTVKGVEVLGVRLRGFARTGSTDALVAVLLVLPSSTALAIHYMATARAGISATVGAAVLVLTYVTLVLLPRLARS